MQLEGYQSHYVTFVADRDTRRAIALADTPLTRTSVVDPTLAARLLAYPRAAPPDSTIGQTMGRSATSRRPTRNLRTLAKVLR